MARQPKPLAPAITLPELPEQTLIERQNMMAQLQHDYRADRDLIAELLGETKMADAFAKFSQTVWISKLSLVKQHKLYRGLAGKKLPNGLVLSGTWLEYCNLLGISDEKANQDIANLNMFGEEALEKMTAAGIGYRELSQFRKLPEDQKSELIELAKSGDQAALLDAAEAIIAKQQQEKEALKNQLIATQQSIKQQADEAKAEYNALQQRNADLSREKEALSLKLTKFELKTIPLDERLSPFNQEIVVTQSALDTLLAKHRQYIVLLDELQRELIANDPHYDPEQIYTLPHELLTTLDILSQSIKLSYAQIRQIYQELLHRFGDEIKAEQHQFDQLNHPVVG